MRSLKVKLIFIQDLDQLEWDIAAGIILLEAGGKLKTIDNKDLVYNKKEDILNPHFFAYAHDAL